MPLQSVWTKWGWKLMGEPDEPLAPNIQYSARAEGVIERENLPSAETLELAAAMPSISEEMWQTGAITQAMAEQMQAEIGQTQVVGPVLAGLGMAPIGALMNVGGTEIGTSTLQKFAVPGPIPVGGNVFNVIKAGAGLLVGAGVVTGTAGAILKLIAGGGSPTSIVKSAVGLIAGGGNGGASMTITTGQSVDNATAVNGVPFGGPGVPEPPAGMVAKAWKTKAFSHTAGEYWVYFWRLLDGRVMCWNGAKREAKIWRPKKNMVLSQNPRLPALLKFSRKANAMLFKLDKQADKARRQFGVVRVVHESGKKR